MRSAPTPSGRARSGSRPYAPSTRSREDGGSAASKRAHGEDNLRPVSRPLRCDEAALARYSTSPPGGAT